MPDSSTADKASAQAQLHSHLGAVASASHAQVLVAQITMKHFDVILIQSVDGMDAIAVSSPNSLTLAFREKRKCC